MNVSVCYGVWMCRYRVFLNFGLGFNFGEFLREGSLCGWWIFSIFFVGCGNLCVKLITGDIFFNSVLSFEMRCFG